MSPRQRALAFGSLRQPALAFGAGAHRPRGACGRKAQGWAWACRPIRGPRRCGRFPP